MSNPIREEEEEPARVCWQAQQENGILMFHKTCGQKQQKHKVINYLDERK